MNKDIKQFLDTSFPQRTCLQTSSLTCEGNIYIMPPTYLVEEALKFLSKVQDTLRKVFKSVWTLVFSFVKWELGLIVFWRLGAHVLILSWRCVLFDRKFFLCVHQLSTFTNWDAYIKIHFWVFLKKLVDLAGLHSCLPIIGWNWVCAALFRWNITVPSKPSSLTTALLGSRSFRDCNLWSNSL